MSTYPRTGEVFDCRYELLEILGSGGQSTVFKATQLDCDRRVAIKILHPDIAGDPEFKKRFMLEAKALCAFNNASIVTVYHIAQSEFGLPYMVMELVRGQTVRQRLNESGPFVPEVCLQIIIRCARALEHVHESAFVHRDLKPENVVIVDEPEPNSVKLIDFGLARFEESKQQKLTSTGQLIGSVFYMSPEQCMGHKADKRSDIYSLCACMYEMLTGAKPFNADNSIGLMYKHINEPTPQILETQINPFDERINKILSKGMAKSPDNRYQNMSDLIKDLESLSESWGSNAQALSNNTQKQVPNSRTKLITASAVLALLALILGTSFLNKSPTIKNANSSAAPDKFSAELQEQHYSWRYVMNKVQVLDSKGNSEDQDALITAYLKESPSVKPFQARSLSDFCCDPLLAERCLSEAQIADIKHTFLLLAAGNFKKCIQASNGFFVQHQYGIPTVNIGAARLIGAKANLKLGLPDQARKLMMPLSDLNTAPNELFPFIVQEFLELNESQLLSTFVDKTMADQDTKEPKTRAQTPEGLDAVDFPRWKASQKLALIAQICSQLPQLNSKTMTSLRSISKNVNLMNDSNLSLFLQETQLEPLSSSKLPRLSKIAKEWIKINGQGAIPNLDYCVYLPSSMVSTLLSQGLYKDADTLLDSIGYYSFKTVANSIAQNFEEQRITAALLAHQDAAPVKQMLNKIPVSRRRVY